MAVDRDGCRWPVSEVRHDQVTVVGPDYVTVTLASAEWREAGWRLVSSEEPPEWGHGPASLGPVAP